MSISFADLKTRLNHSVLRADLEASLGDYINEALREIQNRRSWRCMKKSELVSIAPGTVQAQVFDVVSAGTAAANGVYTYSLTASGWLTYKNPDGYQLLTNSDGSRSTIINSASIVQYSASSGVWTVTAGAAPAPVVIGPKDGLGADLEGAQTAALPADFKELQKRPAVHYLADDGGFIPADIVTEEEQIHRIWAFGGTPMQTWPPRVFLALNGSDTVIGIIEPVSQTMNFRVRYYAFLPDLVNDSDTSPFSDAWPKMVLAKAKAIAFSEINDPIAGDCESEFEKKLAEAIRQEAHAEVQGRETRL